MNKSLHLVKRLWLALLLGCMLLPPVHAATTESTAALQRLTDDLALQLKLTYRDDLATHRERYAQMVDGLLAWNRSQRSHADYAAMEAWLRSSIRESMPGAGHPLPAPPVFSVPRSAIAQLPEPRRETPPTPKTVVVQPQPTKPAPVATKPQPPVVRRDAPSAERSDPTATELVSPAPRVAATKPATRDFWSNHPAAKPLDASNPFRDDPMPTQPQPTSVATLDEPAVRTALRLPVVEASEISVNMPELSSRIGGYNQALRRTEAAIIAADRPQARELARLLSELEVLADQRDFIELYLVGLTPQERQATPKLESPNAALSLLEEKLTAQFGSPATASNSLDRDILPVLFRKLTELQNGIPPTP